METPRNLVIIENKIIPQQCALYKRHTCAVLNLHHICPKSWFLAAGVPVDTPMILICPTCHENIHAAIDARISGRDFSLIPRRCQSLAQRAFMLADIHHLTPEPTL
jgi:hypothetical protein